MRVLIIGAGVAGPVTAMALQEVGIDAAVFEAYPPTDPEVGSYLTLTANGLEALRAIDALDLAAAIGFPTRRNVLWNQDGRRLASLPLDSTLAGSVPAHTLKRSRLARVLQDEAIRRGIPIEFGRRSAGAEVGPDGRVTARFEDGSTATGDLLVGADGVHSIVRRLIDPTAPDGRYVGLTNFGGFALGAARAGGVASGVEPEAWHMIFGRRAFFGYTPTPDGDVAWFANVPRPKTTAEERVATGTEEWQRRLADLFRADAGPATALIEAGRLGLVADNTHDLPHVPRWHRGPIVVIGDAAHAPSPSSGQGASMAIEDGIVLASALRDAPTIGAALHAYERARRERVERIVAAGARSSSSKIPGRAGRIIRDAMLRFVFRHIVRPGSLAWMYDYRASLDRPATGLAGSARPLRSR